MKYDDSKFDVEAVVAGAWAPSRYGHDDVLGTYNEVTDEKRADALAMLDLTRPIRTYSMGDGIWPGYPAFADRQFAQTLVVAGYDPGEGFGGPSPGAGVVVGHCEMLGAALVPQHHVALGPLVADGVVGLGGVLIPGA